MNKRLLAGVALTLALVAVCLFGKAPARPRTVPFDPQNADNLLAVSQAWSSAKELYCYFELLPEDFDWDTAYEEAFHRVAAVEDEYDYYLELLRFMAQLQDGHVSVIPPEGNRLFASLPLWFTYMDGGYYVTVSQDDEIPLYSRLDTINDVDAADYLAEHAAPYVPVRTPLAFEQGQIDFFRNYGRKGDQVKLGFTLPVGQETTATYVYGQSGGQRQISIIHQNPPEGVLFQSEIFTLRKTDPYKSVEDNILLLQMHTMTMDVHQEYTERILPLVSRSKGCIIDLRQNGGGNSLNGAAVLSAFAGDDALAAARPTQGVTQIKAAGDMMVAQLLVREKEHLLRLGLTTEEDHAKLMAFYPEESIRRGELMLEGRYTTATDDAFARYVNGFTEEGQAEVAELDSWYADIPKTDVPAVVLVRHTSGSAVDNTAAMAKELGIPLIGTRTKGATGNIMLIPLANDWMVVFSSQRVLAPDGTDIWNHGIEADIYADYTVQDLQQGIDTPVQRAVAYLTKGEDLPT